MFQEGELVEVRDYDLKTDLTQGKNHWIEYWRPGVIVKWIGKTKMRTGIARFQTLEAAFVLVKGKIRKISTKNLRYPSEW